MGVQEPAGANRDSGIKRSWLSVQYGTAVGGKVGAAFWGGVDSLAACVEVLRYHDGTSLMEHGLPAAVMFYLSSQFAQAKEKTAKEIKASQSMRPLLGQDHYLSRVHAPSALTGFVLSMTLMTGGNILAHKSIHQGVGVHCYLKSEIRQRLIEQKNLNEKVADAVSSPERGVNIPL